MGDEEEYQIWGCIRRGRSTESSKWLTHLVSSERKGRLRFAIVTFEVRSHDYWSIRGRNNAGSSSSCGKQNKFPRLGGRQSPPHSVRCSFVFICLGLKGPIRRTLYVSAVPRSRTRTPTDNNHSSDEDVTSDIFTCRTHVVP